MPQDQYESYRRMIQSSQVLSERWVEVTNKRIAEAAAIGVSIDRDDCLRVDAIRSEAISGDAEVGAAWFDQAQKVLPQFKEAAERARLMEALAKQDEEAMEKVAKMNPSQRMAFARSTKAPESQEQRQSPLTTEQKAAALREVQHLRGAAKLAAARKAGLAD